MKSPSHCNFSGGSLRAHVTFPVDHKFLFHTSPREIGGAVLAQPVQSHKLPCRKEKKKRGVQDKATTEDICHLEQKHTCTSRMIIFGFVRVDCAISLQAFWVLVIVTFVTQTFNCEIFFSVCVHLHTLHLKMQLNENYINGFPLKYVREYSVSFSYLKQSGYISNIVKGMVCAFNTDIS